MIKNKKKRRIKASAVIVLLVIIVLVILVLSFKSLFSSLKPKEQKKVEVLDTIEKYGYKLDENDPKYFKQLFKQLKKELEKDKIDEEKYATLLSQLFITDFYSLNHTINKNDVGGTQFVYKSYQDTFEDFAKNSIYHYVENNMYNNRKQELPDIKEVKVIDITKDSFTSNTVSDEEAYNVTMKLTYEKDLGYPTEAKLVLVHSNDKLEIASMNYDEE